MVRRFALLFWVSTIFCIAYFYLAVVLLNINLVFAVVTAVLAIGALFINCRQSQRLLAGVGLVGQSMIKTMGGFSHMKV